MSDNKNPQLILESFSEFLEKSKINSKEVNAILDKGKKVIESLNEKTDKNDRKGLLVGKVQSGKTLNFISVIVHSFLLGYNIVIVLTSIDNKLLDQTVTRLEKTLNREDNKNFLKFYEQEKIKSFKNNEQEFRQGLIDQVKSNNLIIFPILKNNVEKITEIFDLEWLKKVKVLVIDDEGDLASATHNEKNNSATYQKIENLLEKTNSTYLTVTATPMVHLLMKKTKSLFPKWVFCVDPGKNYIGIDEFSKNEDKYFKIIDNSFETNKIWYREEIFKKSLNYYLLLVAKNLKNEEFNERSHTNMLIHTDIKNEKHNEYKKSVDDFVKNCCEKIESPEDSIEYNEYLKHLNVICKEFEIKDFDISKKENKNIFAQSVKGTRVYEINQYSKDKDALNSNLCSICIGSKMLERGITLDNLLVTFFTNRAKSRTAVDTLLQRARWCGYRTKIINDMKIFTTQRIIDDFREIVKSDESMWRDLKYYEEKNIPLDEVEFSILLNSRSLVPTNKAPLNIYKAIGNMYWPYVLDLYKKRDLFKNLVKELKNSNVEYRINNKYYYKKIVTTGISSKFGLKEILNIFETKKEVIEEFVKQVNDKNKNIIIVLLDSIEERGEPRIRDCYANDGKIKQVFQGSNGKPGDEEYYPGDIWNRNKEINDVILQIHKIKPECNEDSNSEINHIDFVYLPALILPKDIEVIAFGPKE